LAEGALIFSLAEAEPPLYQKLAPEIARLRQLGLSRRRIAIALGIDDKTVAKAFRWSLALG
jgi:hypothetical protein